MVSVSSEHISFNINFPNVLGTPEADRAFVKSLKPTLEFKRNGESVEQLYELMPGMSLNNTLKFGEEYETSDTTEPKKWHNKVGC